MENAKQCGMERGSQILIDVVADADLRCIAVEPIGIRYPPVPHASSIPGAPPSFIGLTGRDHPPINSLPLCDPFVGREDLTKEILEDWVNWEGPMPRRISLSGLGGVG